MFSTSGGENWWVANRVKFLPVVLISHQKQFPSLFSLKLISNKGNFELEISYKKRRSDCIRDKGDKRGEKNKSKEKESCNE